MVSHALTQSGGVPAFLNFGGSFLFFLSIYAYTLDAELLI